MKSILVVVAILMIAGCQTSKETTTTESGTTANGRNVPGGQTEIGLISETGDSLPKMPITGIAENLKGGATVSTRGERYWIQDLHSWDDRYVDKPVRVWGTIEIRYDAPVFLDTSEIVSQGIPVESEEEMKAQSKRYWIVGAKYELVRP